MKKKDLYILSGGKNSGKSDHITSMYRYCLELEQENKQLKKALELACDYVLDEWAGTKFGKEAEKFGGFVNYFIEQAKDSLK